MATHRCSVGQEISVRPASDFRSASVHDLCCADGWALAVPREEGLWADLEAPAHDVMSTSRNNAVRRQPERFHVVENSCRPGCSDSSLAGSGVVMSVLVPFEGHGSKTPARLQDAISSTSGRSGYRRGSDGTSHPGAVARSAWPPRDQLRRRCSGSFTVASETRCWRRCSYGRSAGARTGRRSLSR